MKTRILEQYHETLVYSEAALDAISEQRYLSSQRRILLLFSHLFSSCIHAYFYDTIQAGNTYRQLTGFHGKLGSRILTTDHLGSLANTSRPCLPH